MENINDLKGDQEKIIQSVMNECAKDYALKNNKNAREHNVYDWLDNTAKDIIAIELANKLNELGYKIIKKK